MECRTILIKIHRRRLFEDGFQHIKSIADDVLKHHVKIMFVNELGKLDSLGGAHPKNTKKNQSLHQNRQIGIVFLVFFGFLKFPNWHWFFFGFFCFFFGFFWH